VISLHALVDPNPIPDLNLPRHLTDVKGKVSDDGPRDRHVTDV